MALRHLHPLNKARLPGISLNDQEKSQLNHRDTEDTETNRGAGNFAPSDETPADVPNDVVVEPIPDAQDEVVSGSNSSEVGVVEQQVVSEVAIESDVLSDTPVEQVAEVQADDILAVDAPDEAQEAVVEQKTLQLPKQQVSGWQRIRRFFLGSFAEDIARINNLTQAIEDAPESSVNYVLRAELYMKIREYVLAQLDFQRAYELAETQFELADWGLLDQVMRDRALTGLEKVQRRLR